MQTNRDSSSDDALLVIASALIVLVLGVIGFALA